MKRDDRILLLQALDDELSAAERELLAARLAAEPELRRARDRLAGIRAAVRNTRRPRFEPGFTDRVMAGLAPAVRRPLRSASNALAFQFRRLAPAALALIAALLAYNLSAELVRQSALEAALGLQPVTVETAYETGAYDVAGLDALTLDGVAP